jgi:hypothetical protein
MQTYRGIYGLKNKINERGNFINEWSGNPYRLQRSVWPRSVLSESKRT